jgi:hypothetical protein
MLTELVTDIFSSGLFGFSLDIFGLPIWYSVNKPTLDYLELQGKLLNKESDIIALVAVPALAQKNFG